MEHNEIRDIIEKEGFIITHSPDEVTHAICTLHGRIVLVDADDHNCIWIRSLKKKEKSKAQTNSSSVESES